MKFEAFNDGYSGENNYYEILGINQDASLEEIKRAYKNLAKETHPDAVGDNSRREDFYKITQAYETLIDEDKRKLYDKMIDTNRKPENSKNQEYSAKEEKQELKDFDLDYLLDFTDYFFENNPEKINLLKEYFELNILSETDEQKIEKYHTVIKITEKLERTRQKVQQKMEDMAARKEDLDRKRELFEKKWQYKYEKNDRLKSSHNASIDRQKNNLREKFRNLVDNIGVVTDGFGYESLVDCNTGLRIGFATYKKIEYLNGVIIGTDSLGYKQILPRDGKSSFRSYQDIILRDDLVIAKDFLGERLLNKDTGEPVGYRSYKTIQKIGNKIFGTNLIGIMEEIKL